MKKLFIVGSSIGLLFISSCNDSDENGPAKVNVRLTDGPAAYDTVNIDIQKIEINSNGE
ncbi:hypothetical protein [Chryseobacterium arthrosphaerae]|uniref:hypothetical protein n=1 Tax=Chryseobacterium arthrosphaerae TaxID=651561 RepID=UPI00241C2A19|nr:hypothetical protein [Chryseobacterium arthrosphaerae]